MNLELKDHELDYIVKVLTTRPWTEVNTLILSIQRQVRDQQADNDHPVDRSLGDHPGS